MNLLQRLKTSLMNAGGRTRAAAAGPAPHPTTSATGAAPGSRGGAPGGPATVSSRWEPRGGVEILRLQESSSASYPPGFLARTTSPLAYHSDAELDRVRNIGRWLNRASKHAAGAVRSIESYVVGAGISYRIVSREGDEVGGTPLQQHERRLQRWIREHRWQRKSLEAVRRYLVDGEVFLRVFPTETGPQVRFILPEYVREPLTRHLSEEQEASHGVVCNAKDYESILGYFVVSRPPRIGNVLTDKALSFVPAEHVFHLKHGVFSEEKRGIPLFYPWRMDLVRADTLLRTLEQAATNQAQISAIIEYPGTYDDLQTSVETAGYVPHTDAEGRTIWKDEGPGGSYNIHHTGGMHVELPNTGLDGNRLMIIYDRALQAISVAVKLPTFIFSHQTDHANRSNTDRAQDDGLKTLEHLQRQFTGYFEDVLTDVLWSLAPETRETLSVRATPSAVRGEAGTEGDEA